MDYMSTVIPVLMAFAISVVLCPIIIPFLKKMKFGQYVRDDGPKAHLKKAGTPTMGGLIILACIAISFVYQGKQGSAPSFVCHYRFWAYRFS